MVIFKEAATVSRFILTAKNSGKKIGFVPTMVALHKGHISLVSASKKENELTVCSIFIKTTQLNNPNDLKHYPYTLEKDIGAVNEPEYDILCRVSMRVNNTH